MKKFPKIIAGLLLISLLCGIVAVSVAATDTESGTQANQLKPSEATNIFALDFEDSIYVHRNKTGTGLTIESHENLSGKKSLAIVYDGKTTIDEFKTLDKGNGINPQFAFYAFDAEGPTTFIDATQYAYVTYDFDIGTDAYAYDNGEGVKTYTLTELAALEAGTAEDKALAAAVKANGTPAYLHMSQFGPRTQGHYFYQKMVKDANGKWYITNTAANGTAVLDNKLYLSNEVGVYDHLTYVYDLNGDAAGTVYLYIYVNNQLALVYKTKTTKAGLFSTAAGTQHFNVKANDSNTIEAGGYTTDCYSMIFDNMAVNAYAADATTIESFFGKVDYADAKNYAAVSDLSTAKTGLVWNTAYVYGNGSTYSTHTITTKSDFTDFDPFNVAVSGGTEERPFQFKSYGFAMNSAWVDYAAKGAYNGKYTLPNGNNVYLIKTSADGKVYQTPTAQSDMYWDMDNNGSLATIKGQEVDYYVSDFDFASDTYLYDGKYYSIDDVAALKATNPELAAAIEKDGVAAYPGFIQFANPYGGWGTSYIIPKVVQHGNEFVIERMAASNLGGNFFNNVTLSKKVGEFQHFTVVCAFNHAEPAKSAVYYFYNGALFAGAEYTKMDLTGSIFGLKFTVNTSSAVGGVMFDNLKMTTYSRFYSSGNAYGIDDLLGNGFINSTDTKLYDLADVVYNENYVDANNKYVSLDNENKVYIAPLYQGVYDELEDDGTLYLSGVALEAFVPKNATSFTVVCMNGATFTPGGALVIQSEETVDGVTTYTVGEDEAVAYVDWYFGENYLYSEAYKEGAIVAFKPEFVEGGVDQYAGVNLVTGKYGVLDSNAKFALDAEASDENVYDAATGEILVAEGGFLQFNVELSVTQQLSFIFLDSEENVVGNVANYTTLDSLQSIYNSNIANISLLKFFGNGEDILFVDMAKSNSLVVANGKTLTVDLNGQKVWFGANSVLWSPMFQVQTGATLNIINGDVYHLARYGAKWNNISGLNVYTPGSLVAADSGVANINFGVKNDATKAVNFYGTNVLKVTAGANSVNFGVYGGLIQSDNFFGVHTTTYCAKAVFDISSDATETNTIEIIGADIIAGTSNAVFDVPNGATLNTTITDSTVICKTINKNNEQPLVDVTKHSPKLFNATGKGGITIVNSTVVSPAVESKADFTVTLGKNTSVSWPTQYVSAPDGLVAVFGTSDFEQTFYMAKNFQAISNYTHSEWEVFKDNLVDLIGYGYFDLGDVTYTDKLTVIIVNPADLPENVTAVEYKVDDKVVKTVYAAIGATLTHPDVRDYTEVTKLNNGWYDTAYSGWDGPETVTKDAVYVPTGTQIVEAFDKAANLKVGANLSGHLFIELYVLNNNAKVTVDTIRGSAPKVTTIGDVEYYMGDFPVNSTYFDYNLTFAIKYTVTLEDNLSETFTVTASLKLTSYFNVLVNAAGTDALGETGWEKSLAALLQYRYLTQFAIGKDVEAEENEDTLKEFNATKAIYDGFFTKLAAYMPDLDADLPKVDVDENITTDMSDFKDLIVGADFNIGENQPTIQLWVSKAKLHQLMGDDVFTTSPYSVYGYIKGEALTATFAAPVVNGNAVTETFPAAQAFILGSTAEVEGVKVFTPDVITRTIGEKEVECYRIRYIIGDLCNMRAAVKFTLKVNEETTYVGTYSLYDYAEAVQKDATIDESMKKTIKLLYIASVESWNYKVK